MDSLIFDTIVGVVFVFGVFAFAVSGIVEGVARFLGLRAEFLLRGVSSLLHSDTKFGKNWFGDIVTKAEEDQQKADKAAVGQAQDQVADLLKTNPDAAIVTVAAGTESALKLISDAIPLSNKVSKAQADRDTKQRNLRQAKNSNRQQAQTDLKKAEDELDKAQSDLTGPLAAAQRAVEGVPPMLDAAVRGIGAMPPGAARDQAVKDLTEARAIFTTAQRALLALQGQGAVTVSSVLGQPIVDLTAARRVPKEIGPKRLSIRTKWSMPSYLSARTFSRALVDTLVPPTGGITTIEELRQSIEKIGDQKLRQVLLGHLETGEQTVEKFRNAVENWYDDHMARVSGWYKRHTRWYTIGVAAILALLFNVNAVSMATALYSDQALRESVVTAAFSTAKCNAQGKTPANCLADVRNQITNLRTAGLPIGWHVVACQSSPTCDFFDKAGVTSPTGGVRADWARIGLALLGWSIIVFSSLLGARFWFDALSRLNTLRSTGPKPQTST